MSRDKEKDKGNPARPNDMGDTNSGPMGIPGVGDLGDEVITGGGSDLGPDHGIDDSTKRSGEVY